MVKFIGFNHAGRPVRIQRRAIQCFAFEKDCRCGGIDDDHKVCRCDPPDRFYRTVYRTATGRWIREETGSVCSEPNAWFQPD